MLQQQVCAEDEADDASVSHRRLRCRSPKEKWMGGSLIGSRSGGGGGGGCLLLLRLSGSASPSGVKWTCLKYHYGSVCLDPGPGLC